MLSRLDIDTCMYLLGILTVKSMMQGNRDLCRLEAPSSQLQVLCTRTGGHSLLKLAGAKQALGSGVPPHSQSGGIQCSASKHSMLDGDSQCQVCLQ